MLFGRGRIPPEVTFSIISQLKPSIGWFSVLGDHDELYGINRASSAFSNAGIRVLIDDRETVSLLGYEIDIIGLKPTSANPNKSMAALLLGRPSIVLAHDPAAFSCLPRGPYLMLSGHTHGGQIQLPWIGPLINMSEASLRWTHGIVIENDRHLYVTSGIGTSGIPVRIGIRPEVALISVNGSE
jgi:predicted MPP superfamily phosphohydrolase